MTEKLAQNLKEIELPRSVRNVLRFLADLGIALEPSASKPIGSRSGELAARVFDRHLGVTEMLPSLMARHEIQALDIRRFALWIRQILPEEAPETAAAYHGRSSPEYRLDPEVEDRPLRRSRKALKPEPEEDRVAAPTPRFAQTHRSATGSTSVGETLGMIALAGELARPLWPAALGLSSFAFGVAVSRRWEPSASMVGFPDEVRNPVSTFYASAEEPPSRPLFRGPEVTIEQRSIVDLPVSEGGAASPSNPTVQPTSVKNAEGPTSEVAQTPSLRRREPLRIGPVPLPSNPLLAQFTLIAPPVRTAGIGVSAKGAAVAFDLPLLRKGAEPLTPARLQALRAILPPGVQALYPAIPTDTLGPSAVNVPLAAESISLVVRKGYGRNEPKWAESLAAHSFSTPPMTMLNGRILDPSQPASQAEAPVFLPIKKPFEPSISLIPAEQPEAETPNRPDETTFGLDEPMVRHGGILDVLGLPVHLAESPEKPHDLPKRHAARADLRSVPTPLVRPTLFQEAQRKALPNFHTIASTPFAPKSQSRKPSASPTADHAAKPASTVLPIKKEAPRPMATPVFQPESLRSERAIAPKPVLPAARAAQAPKPLAPTKQTAPETPNHEGAPRIPAPVTVAPAFPVPAIARQAPKPPPKSNPITIPAVSAASNGPVQGGIVNTVVKVEPAPVNVLPIAPAFKPVAASTTTSSATTVRPTMPLVEKKPEPLEDPALAVQASKGDAVAAAGGRPIAQASTNAAGGKGSKDAEIGLLANEVWSLLKRRLAFEAQRAGQR